MVATGFSRHRALPSGSNASTAATASAGGWSENSIEKRTSSVTVTGARPETTTMDAS